MMINLNYLHIANSYNTIITDAILQEYHYQNKSTSYHGVAKVGANITSQSIGLTDLGANLGFNQQKIGVIVSKNNSSVLTKEEQKEFYKKLN